MISTPVIIGIGVLQIVLLLIVIMMLNDNYHAIKERKELENDKNKQSTKAGKDVS